MTKVSVIVPFYNVEPYLERCLDSLLHQTAGDFEVIMIDDGSMDKSRQIASSFAEKDGRFLLFHEENQGEAAARNLGLEKSSGEYIMFLDADDYYSADSVEKALTSIEAFDCGIVIFGSEQIDEQGNLIREVTPVRSGKFRLSEHPEILMEIENCTWDKIYRKQLFVDHNIRYLPGYYTDFSGTFRIVVSADEIGFIQDHLINYSVGRAGSITSQFSEKCFAIFDMIDSIMDHFRQIGVYDTFREEIKGQAILNIIDKMKLAVISDNRTLRKEFINRSYEYMFRNFGDLKSKYDLKLYKNDFLYFHPGMLKLYLLLKGKL